MEIRDRYRDYITVYTECSRDGIYVACATMVPSNTVISMRLSDAIFTAEVWVIIKVLEQIKDSVASKYIIFPVCEAGTSLGWDGDTKVCTIILFRIKTLFDFGNPIIFALESMKRQILLPRPLWICLVQRLVYPIMILNIVSASIFFPLGTVMIGMVRSRTSFILWSRSWKICSPPTCGAGSM